jgi:hypothetical protein
MFSLATKSADDNILFSTVRTGKDASSNAGICCGGAEKRLGSVLLFNSSISRFALLLLLLAMLLLLLLPMPCDNTLVTDGGRLPNAWHIDGMRQSNSRICGMVCRNGGNDDSEEFIMVIMVIVVNLQETSC